VCGCGAYGQSADEHMFQPKWCSSSPVYGMSVQPTTCPYDEESGSTSRVAIASGCCAARSKAATYASVSFGAAAASRGEG
jgi:hypothetical protein